MIIRFPNIPNAAKPRNKHGKIRFLKLSKSISILSQYISLNLTFFTVSVGIGVVLSGIDEILVRYWCSIGVVMVLLPGACCKKVAAI